MNRNDEMPLVALRVYDMSKLEIPFSGIESLSYELEIERKEVKIKDVSIPLRISWTNKLPRSM